MREIKFRAWDVSEHEYKCIPNLLMNISGKLYWHFGLELHVVDPTTFVIEQYTGLTDKTGKKIYEGDILTIKNTMMSSNDPFPGRRVVKWNEEKPEFSAAFIDGNCQTSGLMFVQNNTTQYYEIIGNIHENKELLNDTE